MQELSAPQRDIVSAHDQEPVNDSLMFAFRLDTESSKSRSSDSKESFCLRVSSASAETESVSRARVKARPSDFSPARMRPLLTTARRCKQGERSVSESRAAVFSARLGHDGTVGLPLVSCGYISSGRKKQKTVSLT